LETTLRHEHETEGGANLGKQFVLFSISLFRSFTFFSDGCMTNLLACVFLNVRWNEVKDGDGEDGAASSYP